MEVLAGVIIGILFAILYFKKPIEITINHNNKEITPEFKMPTMNEVLNKVDSETGKEDKAYTDDMSSFLQEVNTVMLGGKPIGKD